MVDEINNSKTSRDSEAIRRQRDFDDQQHELAGREVGRQSRFLSEGGGAARGARRKGGDARSHLSALERLLQNDPAYAALYHDTMDLLTCAERATESALESAEHALSEAEEALQGILEKANKLPDGGAVFKDAHGNIRTEDGRLVEAHELEGQDWHDGAPSYEDYLAQKKTRDEARNTVDDLRHYQVHVLGNARDRMSDPANPPSKEEMEGIQEDIKNKASQEVRNEIEPSQTPEIIETTFESKGPSIQ